LVKEDVMILSVFARFVVIGVLLFSISGAAQANLIVNGDFDTDLSGWTIAGSGTGVTWDSGTAHVGRPGANGTAIFEQSFDILSGVSSLLVAFDYQWQIIVPSTPDFFLAELVYQSTSGLVTETLVSEDSNASPFNTTLGISSSVILSDVAMGSNNGTIRFTVTESNTAAGTRIQLDNVAVNAVPLPGVLLLLIAGLAGMVAGRRGSSQRSLR
jgi:hypothetical protein